AKPGVKNEDRIARQEGSGNRDPVFARATPSPTQIPFVSPIRIKERRRLARVEDYASSCGSRHNLGGRTGNRTSHVVDFQRNAMLQLDLTIGASWRRRLYNGTRRVCGAF